MEDGDVNWSWDCCGKILLYLALDGCQLSLVCDCCGRVQVNLALECYNHLEYAIVYGKILSGASLKCVAPTFAALFDRCLEIDCK